MTRRIHALALTVLLILLACVWASLELRANDLRLWVPSTDPLIIVLVRHESIEIRTTSGMRLTRRIRTGSVQVWPPDPWWWLPSCRDARRRQEAALTCSS